MISKNLSLTHNTSRDSVTHEFTTQRDNIIVGNIQPYGSPNISCTARGVLYPNVQAAVDDLASLYEMPINTVVITDDGVSPAGRQQQDEFKFTGLVAASGKTAGQDVNFNFLGFNIVAKVGETGEEVAAKVKAQLEIAMSNKFVINRVNFGSTNDVLQVMYNDCQTHIIDDFAEYGIRISQTILSPARPGYGTWFKLGTQTIQLDGSAKPTVLYYFKRTS
ncbi:hypothetical protein ACX818_001282 [Acinetobacter baumannii]